MLTLTSIILQSLRKPVPTALGRWTLNRSLVFDQFAQASKVNSVYTLDFIRSVVCVCYFTMPRSSKSMSLLFRTSLWPHVHCPGVYSCRALCPFKVGVDQLCIVQLHRWELTHPCRVIQDSITLPRCLPNTTTLVRSEGRDLPCVITRRSIACMLLVSGAKEELLHFDQKPCSICAGTLCPLGPLRLRQHRLDLVTTPWDVAALQGLTLLLPIRFNKL
jgi:hypothetical protein